MTTIAIPLDANTEQELKTLAITAGISASEMASRLLRRAVRAKKPRPVWDVEAIGAHSAAFAVEDEALAESDAQHRAALLTAEDEA